MPIVIGCDPGQKAGYCFYDTDRGLSAMEFGVLKPDPNDESYEEMASTIAFKMHEMLKERWPDRSKRPAMAAIEMPPRQKFIIKSDDTAARYAKVMGVEAEVTDDDHKSEGREQGLGSIISTSEIAAALCTVFRLYKIPFVIMKDSRWRKLAYGFGTQKGWRREDWKKHARTTCAHMRVTVTNDDQAEACMLAIAGAADMKFKKLVNDAEAKRQGSLV